MGPRLGLHARARVNVAHYPPGVTWGPRVLEDHELVWILSGSATWTVQSPGEDLREIVLTPGMIALSRPGVREAYAWDPHHHSSHAWVHFDLATPEPLGPSSTWPLVRNGRDHPVLAGLCGYLITLADDESCQAQERSAEVLELLLDLFVLGPFLPQGSGFASPVVAAALDYVRGRWQHRGPDIVPLADIAASVGLSEGHLSREFHATFRTGLSGALEIVRLTGAAITLQRTNMTLAEVAHSAGFSDAYHLSRRFSRIYGRPPGRFRRLGTAADPMLPLEHAGLTPVWASTLGRADEM